MWVFLLVYFTLYGALNAYAVRLFQRAFPDRLRWTVGLGITAFLMLFMPIVSRIAEVRGYVQAARTVAWTGYVWMLLALWYVCFGFLADAWNGLFGLMALRWPCLAVLRLAPRRVFLGIAILSALLGLRGVWEVGRVRLRTIRIPARDFPANSPPLRIVQIADVHLGLLVRERRLEAALGRVREARPDLIVSTGDLVDSGTRCLDGLLARLADLRPPLGKFAVLGNHEHYAGLERSIAAHEAAGFRLLRAQAVTLEHGPWQMRLAGVDDSAGHTMGLPCADNEAATLPPAEGRPFTILLKHQPRVTEELLPRFDLQLSGHTHGGQVFPFQLFVRLVYRAVSGLHVFPNGTRLNISRGIGTWGPPVRVFAPPEVVLILIEPPTASTPGGQGWRQTRASVTPPGPVPTSR